MTSGNRPNALRGTLAGTLTNYAAGTTYQGLPDEVAERAKMIIYDQLACGLVGSALPAGKAIARYVEQLGGVRESAVLGLAGHGAPAAMAALANGTAGHADEFDSVHSTADFLGTGHPAAVVVHAAAAVAERQSLPGAELVNAVVLGYDVGSRTISSTGGLKAMESGHGLYAGSLHSIGAAFASARLLGLDQRRMLYAAALALSQSLNNTTFFGENRHMSKALAEGQSASAGVSGALLAALGFEASENVFETRAGILDTWGAPERRGELVKDLGSEFAVTGANFKFYSAGYPIHSAVEAALELKSRNAVDLGAIKRIRVRLPAFPASVVNDRAMPTISLQHMVAVALVAGGLGFDEAHSASLQSSPEVLRLRSLVELTGDPDFEPSQPRGATVSFEMSDGQTGTEYHVDHPRGHRFREPQPTWSDLRGKWDELLARRIGQRRSDEYFDACVSLDAVDDVTEVTAALAGARR
ncbi:MmgE/PrpD family protein [Nocardiopsis synnemataformans]|uniref:MmgE/PrpD family protein n=1 Tax=Nocardiopsis synnemataformans TaxID=61305 RepID=UPI003EBF7A2B